MTVVSVDNEMNASNAGNNRKRDRNKDLIVGIEESSGIILSTVFGVCRCKDFQQNETQVLTKIIQSQGASRILPTLGRTFPAETGLGTLATKSSRFCSNLRLMSRAQANTSKPGSWPT